LAVRMVVVVVVVVVMVVVVAVVSVVVVVAVRVKIGSCRGSGGSIVSTYMLLILSSPSQQFWACH